MLNLEQQEVVNSTKSKIVVISSAASGKTRTLTERIRRLIKEDSTQSIVAITFTNAAAEEMSERLQDVIEAYKPPLLFIGTMHSYANTLLITRGIFTSQIVQDENFDQLLTLVKEHPKCVKPVDHLLLDEAQDSSEADFEFILRIIKPKNYLIVGDLKQSIYSFRGGQPNLLEDLSNEPGVYTYELVKNYRNTPNILNYAKSIIKNTAYGKNDRSIAVKQHEGKIIQQSLEIEDIVDLVNEHKDYKDWFIITRTNKELAEIETGLIQYIIPYTTFKRSSLTNEELNQELKKNVVKLLTIHTSKGLESKKVIAVGVKYFNNEERRIGYVAATRAEEELYWSPYKKKKKQRYSDFIERW